MVGIRGGTADPLYQQSPADLLALPHARRHVFLGASEWTFGTLLFLGFWNKRLGILGALGSCATFIGTVTIIPFIPDGWDASAGGFPAMTGNVPFLMKDVVLLAVSVYLFRQDVMRVLSAARQKHEMGSVILPH